MTLLRCSICGQPHDLERLEPAFPRPDGFLSIPSERRQNRANDTDDGCILVSEDGQTLTYYLRTVLPVPIRGEVEPIRWGVWVEVDYETYMTVVAHQADPEQASLGSFPATLANRLPHYPSTLGLAGAIRPTSPATRPVFHLAPSSDHPFAREATGGVLPERAIEWRLWIVHPPSAGAG
jgi:hypothetical protein